MPAAKMPGSPNADDDDDGSQAALQLWGQKLGATSVGRAPAPRPPEPSNGVFDFFGAVVGRRAATKLRGAFKMLSLCAPRGESSVLLNISAKF